MKLTRWNLRAANAIERAAAVATMRSRAVGYALPQNSAGRGSGRAGDDARRLGGLLALSGSGAQSVSKCRGILTPQAPPPTFLTL